jgi:hypothetical protein
LVFQSLISNATRVSRYSEVRASRGAARLICANHCCAHIDEFHGVVQGVKELLAPDGVWIFEVGYLLEVGLYKLNCTPDLSGLCLG